jgi:hypothetical protein
MTDTTPRHLLTTDEAIRTFITGGNATFTVLNTETGNRWTYRVSCKRKPADEGGGVDSPFFVSVMCGSDNENDYRYVGFLPSCGTRGFRYGNDKAKLRDDHEAVRGFNWLWSLVNGRTPNGNHRKPHEDGETEYIARYPHVEVWHEGRCARCGRLLTVPESIESGFGPECIKLAS